MCLKLKGFSIKRLALTDKICYKFLDKNSDGFETPYQYKNVVIGDTYKSELNRTCCNEIEEGLHSFVKYKDAKAKGSNSGYSIVVECVIPRGSWYYVGKFAGLKSYASSRLKYVKII